jgi:hypothetical protein
MGTPSKPICEADPDELPDPVEAVADEEVDACGAWLELELELDELLPQPASSRAQASAAIKGRVAIGSTR